MKETEYEVDLFPCVCGTKVRGFLHFSLQSVCLSMCDLRSSIANLDTHCWTQRNSETNFMTVSVESFLSQLPPFIFMRKNEVCQISSNFFC